MQSRSLALQLYREASFWRLTTLQTAIEEAHLNLVRRKIELKDGVLDADYFAVAMHLTMKTKRGGDLPEKLPPELVPPAHR